jgi:ribosome-binding factor A
MMRHYLPLKEQVRRLCAELGEDDGQVPGHQAHKKGQSRRSARDGQRIRQVDRKASQLCRQVAVTLDGVFADCGDLVLQNLHVASVSPFPDGSRLLVTVAWADGLPARVGAPAVVLDHLNHASGHLRREVASAVTRKRTPLLVYRLAEPALSSAKA